MISLDQISSKIKAKFESRFVRNVGWMGASDLFARVSYLLTTITLARLLSSYDYGLAAIVITINELMLVFTRVGIGTKLIQSDQEDFEVLCNSAYWLNWLVFVTLFFAQCGVAFGVARFYRDAQLILPICVMGITYLLVPISSIQASLIVKENRLKVSALVNTVQLTASNLMAILFAIMGLGMWAVILPKVLGAPIWVYMYYSRHPWRPTQGFMTQYWGELLSFGKNILGVQLLKALRNNLDYLLIGRLIGIEELGIYFFAFNAGLGLSLSVINAVNSALYPHLCSVRSNIQELQKTYFSSLKAILPMIVPIVLLQSFLAPIYVPLIFGSKWVVAVPILILICLSAIPRPFADAASSLMVAVGRPDIDLRWNVIFTGLFMVSLVAGIHYNLEFLDFIPLPFFQKLSSVIGENWKVLGVALAVVASHWIFLPLYTLWASRYVFTRLRPQP